MEPASRAKYPSGAKIGRPLSREGMIARVKALARKLGQEKLWRRELEHATGIASSERASLPDLQGALGHLSEALRAYREWLRIEFEYRSAISSPTSTTRRPAT